MVDIVQSGGGDATAAQLTADMMQKYGLTREQAIGAVGVMGYESGNFRVMQEQNPQGGRGGWGYAQWTGPRRTDFDNFVKANNLDPASYAANWGMIQHEIATNPQYARAIAALKQTGNVADAARSWETNYEGMTPGGPGVPAFEQHIARAVAYNQRLPGNLSTVASTGGAGGAGGADSAGGAVAAPGAQTPQTAAPPNMTSMIGQALGSMASPGGGGGGMNTAMMAQAAPPAPGPQMAFRAAADDAANASNLTAGGPSGASAAGQPETGPGGMTGLLGLMADPTAQSQVQLPTDVPMTGMSGLLYSGGAGLGIRRPAVTRLT